MTSRIRICPRTKGGKRVRPVYHGSPANACEEKF